MDSNIWLKDSQPFSYQSAAFDFHPQVSGHPLGECLTTPLDRIGEVQLNELASWNWLVSSAQSTCSYGVHVWTLWRPFKTSVQPDWSIPLHFWCLFGSLSCWNTQLHTRLNLLLVIVGVPQEFGDNPLSPLFYLLSVEQQIHWQQNSHTP